MRGVASLPLLVLLLAGGCASSFRERVSPAAPGVPQVAPWSLNRELLTPVNRRIVFVVELIEGHPPERVALDGLARLAARYGERPATWIAGGKEPPKPDKDTSYVFVRYVGNQLPRWGLSYTRTQSGRVAYYILINQEKHRAYRGLIPERHLEQQTLVHEYGHLLGLPTWDHGYYPNGIPDGMHCVNPDCALAKPRLKTLLYGFLHVVLEHHYLEDYCATCRAAIAAAKRLWHG